MGIFKSLFKNNKNANEVAPSTQKVYTEKEQNESMQCMGLDFLLGQPFSNIHNMTEVLYTEQYSCAKATINNRNALLLISTVMYPEDFNKDVEENMDTIIKIATRINPNEDIDIYAVGIGLINKNASEEEKDIYKIGEKYSVAVGNFYLIKTARDSELGFSIEKPIKLSMVSDEYYYIQHLRAKTGDIIDCERLGSYSAEQSSDLIDKWEVTVGVRDCINLIFKFPLFLNAYGFDPIKTSINDKFEVPMFFEWISD